MKRESRRTHNPVETSSEESARIASNLAPLEEQQRRQDKNGSIVLDTGELKLPKDFIEEDKQSEGYGLDRVVVFLLVIVLAFIAFIAYLISIEPPK